MILYICILELKEGVFVERISSSSVDAEAVTGPRYVAHANPPVLHQAVKIWQLSHNYFLRRIEVPSAVALQRGELAKLPPWTRRMYWRVLIFGIHQAGQSCSSVSILENGKREL
mmetsp:Transcript_15305/g.37826  ORF Transcript_15305/g.37826 Transcript_15305/m.37826 type:complete len:114 (-) Transcript_15305:1456-1797(-)